MVLPYAVSKSGICSALRIKPNIKHLSWRADMGKLNVNEMRRVETALPKLDRYQQQAIVAGIFNPVLELEEYGGVMKTMAQNGIASLSALRLPDERVPRLAAPPVTTSLQALQVSTLSARGASSGSRSISEIVISEIVDELLEIALKDENLDKLAKPLIEIMAVMGESGKALESLKKITEVITDLKKRDSIRFDTVLSLLRNDMREEALIVARSVTEIETKEIGLETVAKFLWSKKMIKEPQFFRSMAGQRKDALEIATEGIKKPRLRIEELCKVGAWPEALSLVYNFKDNPKIQVDLLELIIAESRKDDSTPTARPVTHPLAPAPAAPARTAQEIRPADPQADLSSQDQPAPARLMEEPSAAHASSLPANRTTAGSTSNIIRIYTLDIRKSKDDIEPHKAFVFCNPDELDSFMAFIKVQIRLGVHFPARLYLYKQPDGEIVFSDVPPSGLKIPFTRREPSTVEATSKSTPVLPKK